MRQENEAKALSGAAAALAGLKDFQRETVDYVFDRLFEARGSRRYLVADEVGLGKTLIARGVIARSIEHLRDKVDRIDVVYICSNADIARQNINRLRVEGEHVAFASRLTLLPRFIEQLRNSPTRVNFISFTPATSFDLNSGLGHVDERILLHAMLRELWGFGNAAPPMNVLQGHVDSTRFRERARSTDLSEFDPTGASTKAFGEVLEHRIRQAKAEGVPDLRTRFEELCEAYATARSQPDRETSALRSRFVGDLRAALAASCVKTLEPDLVILDEFQRFSHLLDGEDDAASLARELFAFRDVRVLLLSATPYKMYTEAGDPSGENHYEDFVRTLRFLENAPVKDASIDALLKDYRRALLDVVHAPESELLKNTRAQLEARLRRVMVRTERLASTPDRNGMLKEVSAGDARVTSDDALGYLALQKVARLSEHHDTLEYWKSAPYVLNFMDDGYKLKRDLLDESEAPESRFQIAKALTAQGNHRLPWERVDRYAEIDPGNGRMRALLDQTIGQGAYRLLWLAPSLPYYRLKGAFAEPGAAKLTKRLIFSSWRFAPRAIAAILSFEAERRMFGREEPEAYQSEKRRRRGTFLRFRVAEGRPTGMPVLALMYPSVFLARACDPIRFAAETFKDGSPEKGFVNVDDVLTAAKTQIDVALRRLPAATNSGRVDERWYWAAPLLLDRLIAKDTTKAWFDQADLSAQWAGENDYFEELGDESWKEHVEAARRFASGEGEPLGRRPDDLTDVLAEMAIAAPGVALVRSMLRVVGLRTDSLSEEAGLQIRTSAARAAWAFRALFNQPEVTDLLEREIGKPRDLPYWRTVLEYCVDGCLQSVLDEYAHVLRDHLGLITGTAGDRIHEIAEHIADALSLRTASLTTYDVDPSESGRTVRQVSRRMRCHFALRFGEERSEDGEATTRADSVRKAFNSPFWPFVVATTSVGQEGLDFHTYCHAVMHWNLPTNPVDLEQREGRVHRYKGHAVRKNVATTHGLETLGTEAPDVWEAMFDAAKCARPPGSTDVVPYWVYPTEGGARIERHVLALPLSREREVMHRLASSLAVYRMVFGQPRQDDLLRHLVDSVDAPTLARIADETRIDLAPSSPKGANGQSRTS